MYVRFTYTISWFVVKECCGQYWTGPGGNTSQSSSCMATYTIMKTIQIRWSRHAGHCWRSRDKLISDVLLWTPSHGWAKAGQPVQTYIQQLCEDMGCRPEKLPKAMNDRERWQERVRDICAGGTTRWWWWWWWYHYCSFTRMALVLNNPLNLICH